LQQQLDLRLAEAIAPYAGERGAIIPALQQIQKSLGYLSKEAITQVARFFKMSESEVFGVATFYAQFRFTPPAEHSVKVCLGTACHVRGGERIMDAIKRELGIESGNTTDDNKFGVERVACFGSCALAPVVVVDDKVYGRLSTSKVKPTLDKHR